MLCGWEGNCRSGVTLAMHHRLKWFIHLQAHSLGREMSTPPMLSCGVWPIYLYLSLLDLGMYEARDLVQNRPLWKLIMMRATVG